MRFGLVKCHGSGNDFPMIDARDLSLGEAEWAGVARALADRSGPVGGDGLLLLVPGDDRSAFGMVMRNSDGSEAETCLNGVRCVARAGFEALGMTEATVRLKTSHADAVRDADLAPGVYTVRETAGPAGLSTAAWPIHGAPEQLVEAVLPILDGEKRFTAVTMPNPHLVHFVETVDEAELVRLGEICEAAPDWLPQRANVSFVEVRGNALFVRTFERGVGLTDSCGSAMAASTYAACLTRRIAWDVPTVVFNRGGLVRAFAGEDGMVTLSGNATYEWAGSVDVDLTSETASDLVVERRYPDEIAAWEAAKRG
ncbi:diaminopimelate epimerase [Sphingomonas sanguinis]|uniref:Diaminopimelate epimerase n=1 Tax=Sphingomonas sanguinis TaxID=33051 RepID=A0A147J5T2_9SPHN|nr:diaminopimelate epimerase [Sphingomonas sanguinis]KTW09685.1 diaminopimelate epimerase [Sphingomonas sanguinis]